MGLINILIPHVCTQADVRAGESADSEHPASPPFPHALIVTNRPSCARDHLANERTFLSSLRLSIVLSVVAAAILLSFHLKTAATRLEQRIALPLGALFWLLGAVCLASGVARYVHAVRGYAARRPIVQSGVWTNGVFIVVGIAVVAGCVIFLYTDARTTSGAPRRTGGILSAATLM